MKLRIDENSTNYPCSVVKIGQLMDIEGADNIKRTVIFGNNVIVSKDTQVGELYLYFVGGTQLSTLVCENYNLYTDSEMNSDKTQKGYISPRNRLIKAVKLRGTISDGLLLPVRKLEQVLGIDSFSEGQTFTEINDVEICKKYVVPTKPLPVGQGQKQPKANKLKELIVENQFRFHHETEHFARNLANFDLEDEIVITRKMHGSSLILSHVLINKPLNWIEKLVNKFIPLPTKKYGYVFSSGKPKSRLPKGIESEDVNYKSHTPSFYSNDIWRKAYELHKDKVEKGISIYGEIVGEGIQGADYTYGVPYEIFVYRITTTNVDGQVYEFSWEEVKNYCIKYGLKYVEQYYVGKLKDFGDDVNQILDSLQSQYLDKSYADCKVDEGICVRLRRDNSIYKLKSPNFIAKESKQLEDGIENES